MSDPRRAAAAALLYSFFQTEAGEDTYEAHNLAVFAPDLAAEAMVCAVLCNVARWRRRRIQAQRWRPDVGSAWDYYWPNGAYTRVTVTGIDGEMVLLNGWEEPAVHYTEFRDTFDRVLIFDEDRTQFIADLSDLGVGAPVYAVPDDGRVAPTPAGPFFLDGDGFTFTVVHRDATDP